jgi:hypothetical protein
MADTLTAPQRQTLKARTAFASKFPDEDTKREYFRRLGKRANAGRIVLSAAEAETIAAAHRSLEGLTGIVAKIAVRVEREAADSNEKGGVTL